jgi:hypothetical protein
MLQRKRNSDGTSSFSFTQIFSWAPSLVPGCYNWLCGRGQGQAGGLVVLVLDLAAGPLWARY